MNIEKLTRHYANIIEELDENPTRDGLKNTPERAAKAMQFLCRGYEQSLD